MVVRTAPGSVALKPPQKRPKRVPSKVSTPVFAETSTTALRRLCGGNASLSAEVLRQEAVAPYPGKPLGREPKHSHRAKTAISSSHRGQSTIPLSSRHLRAPTDFRFSADHPVTAPLGQMFPVRDLAALKTACQQRVAVLIRDIGEVLAGHTDARRPGALQTINEVPFLFHSAFVP